jgi:hypothetical protein
MQSAMLVVVIVLALLSSVTASVTYYVIQSNNSLTLTDQHVSLYVARGTFEDTLMTTGWGVLNIQTNTQFSLVDQYYAAGLIEGFATAHRMDDHFTNMNSGAEDPLSEPVIVDYFKEQLSWTDKQIARHSETSVFWRQMGAIQSQFYGLVEGYKLASKDKENSLSLLQMQLLNAFGDIFDLRDALIPSRRVNWSSLSSEEVESLVLSRGRCSGFVRVTPDYSELYTAHSVGPLFSFD